MPLSRAGAEDAAENVAAEECRENRAYRINVIKGLDGGVPPTQHRVALNSGHMSSRSGDATKKHLIDKNSS